MNSNSDSISDYDERYWTDEKINSICPYDLPFHVARDISDEAYHKIYVRLYQLADGLSTEAIDLTTFFRGKSIAIIGMPVCTKKDYRKDLSVLGAKKVYYCWNDNIQILICGDNDFSPMQQAIVDKRNGHNVIVMNESYLDPLLISFMKSEQGKKLTEEYLAKGDDNTLRAIPHYEIANKDFLKSIHQVPLNELSLNRDVFHAVGRMTESIEDESDNIDGEEIAFIGGYPNTINELYSAIQKKGGRINKKGGISTTCIVFGQNPPINAFKGAPENVKFISLARFYSWLEPQPEIERDDLYKDSTLIEDPSELKKYEENESYIPTLYGSVFHIAGTLYPFDYHCYPNFVPRSEVYAEIESLGGIVDRENTDKTTCVVFGCRPPRQAFKYCTTGKVKYISYTRFNKWLVKEACPVDKDASIFREKYKPSFDATLRPYQQHLKEEIFEAWQFYYKLMLQLPTGTGKTVLFSSIIKDLAAVPNTKILIVAHRKELVEQISTWLDRFQVEHGVIISGRKRNLDNSIQVASIQTYTNKANQALMDSFCPDFIIIDEAHHTVAQTYQSLWSKYPKAWKLGVTATPYRLSHEPFRSLYSCLITSPSMKDFISHGYLSEYVYMVDNPNGDMSKAIDDIKQKSNTGDYVVSTLLKKLNVDKYVKYAVACYLRYAKDKKGIVYAISVEHGKNLCNAYESVGVSAEFIDSTTPKKEREEIVDRFRRGETKIMVNCNIFSEGFDCPDIEFIQMARPTYSLSMFMQQVGRGLRPMRDGSKCIILDNAGMFKKFGLPSDSRPWVKHFYGEYSSEDANTDSLENISLLCGICRSTESPMVEITEEDLFRQRKILKEKEAADVNMKDSKSNNVDIWISILAALLILGLIFLYPALIGLCAFLVVAGVLKKRK